MKFRIPGLLSIACVVLATASPWLAVRAAPQLSPEAVVREVDKRRLPEGGFEATIVITPWKDGTAQEPGRYIVRSNGEGSVLVEATSADQRGQKFLSTESGIFFFAPRTRRAIRITPLQTLRGQASIGDISRVRFAADYEASRTAAATADCRDCLLLDLASKNEASTYVRVLLDVRVAGATYHPVAARMFLASGRLAKTVVFDDRDARLPASARYKDAINLRSETTVVYESLRKAQFPPAMFNPRSLEQ